MLVVQLWGINGGREYRERGYWNWRALEDDVEIQFSRNFLESKKVTLESIPSNRGREV